MAVAGVGAEGWPISSFEVAWEVMAVFSGDGGGVGCRAAGRTAVGSRLLMPAEAAARFPIRRRTCCRVSTAELLTPTVYHLLDGEFDGNDVGRCGSIS